MSRRMGKIANSKDLLMLLLYAKGHKGQLCEPIRGRTRLMKIVFLFEKEIRRNFNLEKVIPPEAIPDFTPYEYGPFSPRVYTDLEFLVELGFVKVTPVGEADVLEAERTEYQYWQATTGQEAEEDEPFFGEEFSLTKLGKSFVEEGEAGKLTDEQWRILNEFKARCTGASLGALLRYVYTKYGDMTTKSKIRDEILSNET